MSGGLLDAAPRLFDAAEYIGLGVQAPLEMAIDEAATLDRWQVAERPPAPIPGQQAIPTTGGTR